MALQPVRCTADHVTIITGGLLPRLFTRSPRLIQSTQGGYFLLHFYPLSEIFPLGSTVPCVARTFLPGLCRNDKAACRCKINQFPDFLQNYNNFLYSFFELILYKKNRFCLHIKIQRSVIIIMLYPLTELRNMQSGSVAVQICLFGKMA